MPCSAMVLTPNERRVRVPSDPDSPPCDVEGGRERRISRGRYIPTGHDGPLTEHSQGAAPL